MSTAPLTFTGVSTYSTDLQTILQRSSDIAKLPITALQNKQADNLSKKQGLISLDPAVAGLGSAVAALGSLAAGGGALVASSSNSNVVTVTNTGATSPGTYTISNIQSLAASAWAITGQFANSSSATVSNSGHVDLTVGANTYHLDLTGTNKNNLTGLVDAINNTAGAGVSASILTTSQGNYLSISANAPGQTTIQLNAVPSPVDQITNTGTGSDTSVARYADSTTAPVSVGGHMSLVVGSSTFQLDLTGVGANNLSGLRTAINNAGAGVTASIASDTNGYYLTVATNDASAQTLQLNDTSANLVTNSAAGTNADFMLNGNIHVVRSSNVVNDVIPGVSFQLQSGGSATLSLANDSSQVSYALQTFVNSYNTLVDQTAQQADSSSGALGGDMLIHEIMSDAQLVASYWNPTGSGSIRSLSDLGITFEDNSGHMTFNSSTFNGLSPSQVSDAMTFLGSSKSGFAMLANNFTQLSDPLTGLIRVQENGYDTANSQITDQITAATDRAAQIQNTMTAKMQIADSLLAQLQSSQNTISASIQSLNYVAFGKLLNSSGE